ncbi:hypothetical protein AX15_003102 [Amanita polypyramis BW_CC]|nr:hypothetical protein AX15_003102 [Amanita polypyramis BW_CC]
MHALFKPSSDLHHVLCYCARHVRKYFSFLDLSSSYNSVGEIIHFLKRILVRGHLMTRQRRSFDTVPFSLFQFGSLLGVFCFLTT